MSFGNDWLRQDEPQHGLFRSGVSNYQYIDLCLHRGFASRTDVICGACWGRTESEWHMRGLQLQ